MGAVAGGIGAALALTIGEVFDGASSRVPSLVIGVADFISRNTPGDVVAWSISNVGTAQKTLFPLGITITTVLFGALIGILGLRSQRNLFIGFGLLGLVATISMATTQGSTGLGVTSAILATTVGAGVAALLINRGQASTNRPAFSAQGSGYAANDLDPTNPAGDRRQFLAWSGGAAATAVALGGIGSNLERSTKKAVESARQNVVVPEGIADIDRAMADLNTLDSSPGISSYITPNDGFYLIDTAFTKPQVDPKDWSLEIKGMVDNPYSLTFDEILAMDLIDVPITLSCVSNSVGGNLVGNAVWTGVPIIELLERAGVQEGATQFFGRSVDDWTAGFPTEALYDGRDALLAIGMNGEPLPVKHGFPARLVVSGLYGYVSAVKWVKSITMTTWEAEDGYWIPRGWNKLGPIKTQSRIDAPRNNATVPAGPKAIGGVAWAPSRGITKVEVQIAGGPNGANEWVEAELGEALSNDTWVQWTVPWDPEPGRYFLRVRATDADGETQGEIEVDPRPNGAEGWHTIEVNVS
ncbi:MAG: molybdopterin-dependent oxidoreductase [Acidimicrobiales bacterium]|nr:molybdopterin-dependent oxidoreductase [Acidimicrobiales bacterium]